MERLRIAPDESKKQHGQRDFRTHHQTIQRYKDVIYTPCTFFQKGRRISDRFFKDPNSMKIKRLTSILSKISGKD